MKKSLSICTYVFISLLMLSLPLQAQKLTKTQIATLNSQLDALNSYISDQQTVNARLKRLLGERAQPVQVTQEKKKLKTKSDYETEMNRLNKQLEELQAECTDLKERLANKKAPQKNENVNKKQPMTIKGNIKLINMMDNKTPITDEEVVYYGLFADRARAEKVEKKVQHIVDIANTAESDSLFQILQQQEHLVGKTSKVTRSFEETVMPGMVILFVTPLDYFTKMLEIREGVTEYKDIELRVSRLKESFIKGEEK